MTTPTATLPKSQSEAAEAGELVAHHFDDWAQQRGACLLGMWVFLASEVLFFGGAITTYLLYRRLYPAAFGHASQHLDVVLGTINTTVLLTSSLTMALAVHAAGHHRSRQTAGWLAATGAFGLLFLGIKFSEYVHKAQEGLLPVRGFSFRNPDDAAEQAQLFFGLYLGLTGLHALHMIIGIALLAGMAIAGFRGRYRLRHTLEVEIAGLYWHFVDIVWIFLFPLLYLVDRLR